MKYVLNNISKVNISDLTPYSKHIKWVESHVADFGGLTKKDKNKLLST